MVGLRLGGPEARLKWGHLCWRHHTQSTVISTFHQALDTATEAYVPETTAWLTKQNSKRRNTKGCSWYTTLETLKGGKTRLATHKIWARASWRRLHFFIFMPHFSVFTINKLQSLPLWKFHTFPFHTMLGSWSTEFVHIHVFKGMHETINNNQEVSKH